MGPKACYSFSFELLASFRTSLHPERVDVVAVVDGAEVDPRRDEEGEQDGGRQEAPADRPVRNREWR